jgi:glycosyltransferase involved in cell wall biosynthesis
MRVLVVSNGYPPRGRWGTEFYTHELVRGLRARGHEPAVLHPERDGTQPRYALEETQADGVRLLRLHNPGDPKKRFAPSYEDPEVERRFAELLERLRPDVVHFTYLLWGLSVRLPAVARERGVPSVVTLTDYGLLCHRGQMFDWRLERCGGPHPAALCARCIREPGPWYGPRLEVLARRATVRALAAVGGLGLVVTEHDLERREARVREALAAAGHLVAPTRGLAEVFRGAGVPAEKLTTLVYAFDERPYAAVRDRPAPETPRFGYLGQFAPHKGLDVLLTAAARLDARGPERSWQVVLHGGPAQGRHRAYAPEMLALRNERRVRIGAPFGPEGAPEVLAGLTALVVPSLWDENAPLSALQARATGVPVLASDVPGLREVIVEGRHGSLFPPGDVEALAERMHALMRGYPPRGLDPGLPLSLDAHLEALERIYGQLVRPSAASR